MSNIEEEAEDEGTTPPEAKSTSPQQTVKAIEPISVVTTEIPLDGVDSPSHSPVSQRSRPPQGACDIKRCRYSRIVVVLLAQWFIVCIGGVAGAATFDENFGTGTKVILSLLFVTILALVMAYLSICPQPTAEFRLTNIAQLRLFNILKFITLSLTLCMCNFGLSTFWTRISWNIVSLSVLLSLTSVLAYTMIMKAVPSILFSANAGLVCSGLCTFIFGAVFNYDVYHTWMPYLLFAGLSSVLFCGRLLAYIQRVSEDEGEMHVVEVDYGVSTALNMYSAAINYFWAKVLGKKNITRITSIP